MERRHLLGAEFKTLIIRLLDEFSENTNSNKKIQSETKDTLTEIKNNLQGNNSRVDETENQINDLEDKEAKNNHQNNKKEKESEEKQG